MPRLITTNMSINNGDVERRYRYFSDYCLEARPDIVAVQEVSADEGHRALQALAKALGHDYGFFYEPVYPGQEDTQGCGVVTRLPVNSSQSLDTPYGGNKFQLLDMAGPSNRPLALANVHLEAHLLFDHLRRRKLRTLTSRLNPEEPQVMTGDFNAIPRLPSIRDLKKKYTSAYEAIHGREPSHTYPTDLGELLLHNGDATRRQLLAMKLGARACQKRENRRPSGLPRVVADYVFVNPLVRIDSAATTGHDELDRAHSDHLGLQVDFSVN